MWSAEVRDNPFVATCGIKVENTIFLHWVNLKLFFPFFFSLFLSSRAPQEKWNRDLLPPSDHWEILPCPQHSKLCCGMEVATFPWMVENILLTSAASYYIISFHKYIKTLKFIQYRRKYLVKGTRCYAYAVANDHMSSSSVQTQSFQWAQSVLEVEILFYGMNKTGNRHRIHLTLNNHKNFKQVATLIS